MVSPHLIIIGITGLCTVGMSVVLFREGISERARRRDIIRKLPAFSLANANGMVAFINPVGAAIQRLYVPDRDGDLGDVVLGYAKGEEYKNADPCNYFGVVVGRVANRIANAKFEVEGKEYQVTKIDGENCLHGGSLGLHKRIFEIKREYGQGYEAVELSYLSPDGEEGYPGNLAIKVRYSMPKFKNELAVSITATTDAATPVNLAQHCYFNLGGHNSGDILKQEMMINAESYTPVDKARIPTGEIVSVAGTPFDLRVPTLIGRNIAKIPGGAPLGYDHNYVLNPWSSDSAATIKNSRATEKPRVAATVRDPASGRVMEVLTTAPGIQFYSGNFLDGVAGKDGAVYKQYEGFCLETQAFPNSVNTPTFPNIILQPGETYHHEVIYRFSQAPL